MENWWRTKPAASGARKQPTTPTTRRDGGRQESLSKAQSRCRPLDICYVSMELQGTRRDGATCESDGGTAVGWGAVLSEVAQKADYPSANIS
ncbi:hypothetical protein ASPBRDRAFT_201804 [Aspergillus brasiliensis CBS 101740]|uniref:Uncharacterized protein n=1 Tax=Aspergillus brasiliensis (strain CBS 101740 / IMI 381727 / IBT 21946) TaxID=767769 RepID=A0A1L9U194_ASPBC|nr:hypothetical protein ASPBRDRAFT_201804 [Aspergillus brasiliensis CBS 101740]